MAILAGPYMHGTSRRDVLICWVTDSASAANSQVRVGTNVNNLNMVFTDNTAVVVNTVLGQYLHTVRVSGLQPNTQYYYNVGNVGISSVGNSSQFFWTAPTIGSNVEDKRFWAQADAGTASAIEIGFDSFNTPTRKVNGMLAIGDNAYGSGTWANYSSVFFPTAAYGNQLKKYNLVACAGNHDYPHGHYADVYTTKSYFNLFKFPIISETGGIPSFNLKYHSWDCGNVHFISLDGYNVVNGVQSVSPNSSQYKWLVNHLKFIKNEVTAGRKKWIIVIEHFPPFSDGGHKTYDISGPDPGEPGIEFRNIFIPLLNQYDVDVCLYGHEHDYIRTRLVHDYNGNGTSVPFSVALHSWPPYQNSQDLFGQNPSYNKIIYSGAVHVIMGNANANGQYTIDSYYGSLPNNMMIISTSDNTGVSALNISPNKFFGSGVIDILVGGGVGGSDRLRYSHIDESGTVKDFFNIDK